ncbi:hypothetical protein [Sideroxydans sp. CL21]|nr:hypothetical protein [Sideroxydans sp. CL21]
MLIHIRSPNQEANTDRALRPTPLSVDEKFNYGQRFDRKFA